MGGNKKMKKLYSNKLVIFSLVLPGIIVFLFAILAPICLSVYYGFTDYSGMGSYSFIGIENYRQLAHDGVFWTSLKNSLLLAIGFICIQHPLALIVAAVLDKLGGKAEGFFRCVYFIPNVIWIKSISTDYYEAAQIDGATKWQVTRKITLPLLAPTIKTCMIFSVTGSLKAFDLIYVMTGGGPNHASEVPATLMYNNLFRKGLYGYGSAQAFFVVIESLLFTFIMNRMFKKAEENASII